MLLQHAWLAPLVKPTAILEEDEEEDEPTPPSNSDYTPSEEPAESAAFNLPPGVFDVEVAEWVIQAIDKRRRGKLGKSVKPALHAAPLDVVATPEAGPKPILKPTENPDTSTSSDKNVDAKDYASTTTPTS
jgi:mitogen-activated protein kinase kinase